MLTKQHPYKCILDVARKQRCLKVVPDARSFALMMVITAMHFDIHMYCLRKWK